MFSVRQQLIDFGVQRRLGSGAPAPLTDANVVGVFHAEPAAREYERATRQLEQSGAGAAGAGDGHRAPPCRTIPSDPRIMANIDPAPPRINMRAGKCALTSCSIVMAVNGSVVAVRIGGASRVAIHANHAQDRLAIA
jgi:hypothetical protein